MSSPLHAVTCGRGSRLVFVHGSAADHAAWTLQLATPGLRDRFEMTTYDRRGTGKSVGPADALSVRTVEEHAADLAALAGGPLLAVGSSFGAAVVLELGRQRPDLCRGIVLCEPPLPPSDAAPPVPAGFLEELDALFETRGGEAASEQFLRRVLGEVAFERLPRVLRQSAASQWPAIRSDCHALHRYRVRYSELGALATPALLLGGDRSPAYFRATLLALAERLPHARLETLSGAGHMMHADAHRAFAARLLAFDDALST